MTGDYLGFDGTADSRAFSMTIVYHCQYSQYFLFSIFHFYKLLNYKLDIWANLLFTIQIDVEKKSLYNSLTLHKTAISSFLAKLLKIRMPFATCR